CKSCAATFLASSRFGMLHSLLPRSCFWLCFLLSHVALARSVALLLVVAIDKVGVILSALSFDYKFIRFPCFLTAFWTCRYHLGQNTRKGVLNVWFALRECLSCAVLQIFL